MTGIGRGRVAVQEARASRLRNCSVNNDLMIAIVDDDVAVGRATRGLLRSLGYATAIFSSAEEFLNSGRLHEISCVISDVRMPGMSGLDLQTRLINEGRRIPIIFMTAFPEEPLRQHVLAAGAHGFLTKPYRAESLLDCLASALRAA